MDDKIVELSSDDLPREVIYRGVTYPEAITREQMRDADRRAEEVFGIPSILLMENAALAVVREIEEYRRFAIVCGTGSNGGDGLAVARHLCIMGKDVRVFILGDPSRGSEDFRTNLKIMSHLAPDVLYTLTDENFEDFEYALNGCETCVDAIFGTGLNRPLEGMYHRAVEAINNFACHVVAVDMPSGLDANTGTELGIAVRAHKTVTFHRMKEGLDLAPRFSGDVIVAHIGIPA
ncbi:MAG: NAD(P)H-hydrate epimerase [Synergistaceae bacterium]|nr:NAD(P)H-hydrate epimerase [Synergistaceae bacterium]